MSFAGEKAEISAIQYQHITTELHKYLTTEVIEIGKMIGSMINNPKSFIIK